MTTGPRPITLADGSTAYSSGLFHTGVIRYTDRRRTRKAKSAGENRPTTPESHAATIARLRDQEQHDPAPATP